MTEPIRILVVDDEDSVRKWISTLFDPRRISRAGWQEALTESFSP